MIENTEALKIMRYKDNDGNIYYIDIGHDKMKIIMIKPARQSVSRCWRSSQNKKFYTDLAASSYLRGIAIFNEWQELRN